MLKEAFIKLPGTCTNLTELIGELWNEIETPHLLLSLIHDYQKRIN